MTITSFPPASGTRGASVDPRIDPRIAERRENVEAEANRLRKRQLIAALAVLAAGIVAFAVLQSPLFAVDRVLIEGSATNSQAIVEASGIAIGEPLINVDLDSARKKIAALPWVLSVSSERSWDGKVVFNVVEREPVAQIQTVDGSALVVDASGRILSRGPSYAAGVGPLTIVGLDPADDGKALWVDDVAAGVVRVAAAVPPDVTAAIDHLRVTPSDYRLALRSGGEVILGDVATIDDQMRALRGVIVSIDLRCASVVDLRTPQSPVIRRVPDCV